MTTSEESKGKNMAYFTARFQNFLGRTEKCTEMLNQIFLVLSSTFTQASKMGLTDKPRRDIQTVRFSITLDSK